MKITKVLSRQHIGWHFSNLWWTQGKRKIINTGIEKTLKEKNIEILPPEPLIYKKEPLEKVIIVDNLEKSVHDSQYETVLSYKDNNVLLEGLKQAKIITNTVEINEGLPENLTETEIEKDLHTRMQRMILESHVLDAEQKKLTKVKDPERPSWNFPRTYGVTKERISKNFISKVLQYVDMTSKKNMLERNYILQDLHFKLPLEKYNCKILLQLRAECAIFSQSALPPITTESTANINLPDIFPLKPTVSLNPEKVNEVKTLYPLQSKTLQLHPHTIFVFYNDEEVRNIFEEEVMEDQIYGRSLLKAFTVAGTFARTKFGENVTDLPQPVTVRCIQTNGKFFHFGILQLNNLNINGSTEKNIWYQTKLMQLFENCSYVAGQPVINSYNADVVKYLYNICK